MFEAAFNEGRAAEKPTRVKGVQSIHADRERGMSVVTNPKGIGATHAEAVGKEIERPKHQINQPES